MPKDNYNYKKVDNITAGTWREKSVRDDRPFIDRLTDIESRDYPPEGARNKSLRGDVELPMPKGGKKDPRLSSPLEGLKKAAEGYKKAKEKGVFK